MREEDKERGWIADGASVAGAQRCCAPTKEAPIMNREHQFASSSLRTLGVLSVSASFFFALHASSRPPARAPQESSTFRGQPQEGADRKSSGCISCHTSTDEPTMHPTKTVHLGCTDCHGGNASISVSLGAALNSPEYNSAKEKAHVQPREASFRNRSNLPERTFTKWLAESVEYIKFVNPGDLRIAPETCGAVGCHAAETRAVSTSMMTHAGMLWGAALYNNGGYPTKNTRFGESYNRDGVPQSIKTSPKPTPEETRAKGVIPELHPLFRWETSSRRRSRQTGRQAERPRLRHRIAHRSRFSRPAENAIARPHPVAAGHK